MKRQGLIASGILLLLLAAVCPSQADKVWTGTTGDWFDGGNWAGGTPSNGDVVIIGAGASVLLTNSTETLSSLTLGSALVFSNWNTTLSATNVTIVSGGTVTVASAFTTNAGVMSNNVWIACSNLTIDLGGSINVDGKGYLGGPMAPSKGDGYGPGRGLVDGGGGGYGGWGGGSYGTSGGLTYGSLTAPLDPGSGGSGGNAALATRNGGGAVRIEATGEVAVNGTITAKGDSSLGWMTGGGSGGGVYITCATVKGSGVVRADGGDRSDGYMGGGGRIAVIYNMNLQMSVAPTPTIRFSALAGSSGGDVSDLGTLYFPDPQLIGETLLHNGRLIIPSWTNWAPANLTVSNVWARIPVDGFRLNVTGNARIDGTQGKLELGGARDGVYIRTLYLYNPTSGCTLTCGGNLLLTNNGSLAVYSGLTDATKTNSSLVQVDGTLSISPGSWIYPVSHPTNGGSVLFRVRDLNIPTNAGFNANARGFSCGWTLSSSGFGPASGASLPGGYGGVAGWGGNTTYGLASAPVEPGSGGCQGYNPPSPGGSAGGLVRIESSGNVVLNGTITANAGSSAGYGSQGGSGGGVYIVCNTFSGSNGTISANAGSGGDNGGGGGGRIAIVYTNAAAQAALPKPTVAYSCLFGTGNGGIWPGDIGTIYFPDTLCLTETLSLTGQLIVPGLTNWAPNTLTITNGWIRLAVEGMRLSVTNDILLAGSGTRLELGGNRMRVTGNYRYVFTETNGPTLTCGGSVRLTNGAALTVYAGMTNAAPPPYGGLVDIVGALSLSSNCWVYPVSHPTNGGSVLFRIGNVTIATNAGFNADGRGFAGGYFTNASNKGYGPGGTTTGGGSYGGQGGNGAATYGSSNAPVQAGSGGRSGDLTYRGGNGGGLIWLEIGRTLTLNGTLTANGGNSPGWVSGGGSGGGIYVTCFKLVGTTGYLSANGGAGSDGSGGGGGRIATLYVTGPTLPTSVNGGSAASSANTGAPGTALWIQLPTPGTIIMLR